MDRYTYNIKQCENDDEVRYNIDEIESIGGRYISSYWDEESGGEAYIIFEAEEGTATEIKKRFNISKF